MAKSAIAPHPATRRTAPHRRPATGRPVAAIAGGIGVVAAALAVVVWLLARPGADSADPAETLLEQMHQAAAGTVAPTHALGGSLAVSYGNGRLNVTAEGLPGKACVQVGWHLAKEGTIIVNGVLPMRLSAARLSELCSDREGGATLTWVPDDGK